MEFDLEVRTEVYRHFANRARPPAIGDVARAVNRSSEQVRDLPPPTGSFTSPFRPSTGGARLSPEARRPGPEEMRQIFAGIGLHGPFWDPQADVF